MTDQWDATFGSTKFTVGGTGNRTATVTSGGNGVNATIIGTTGHATGKWYFELSRDTNNGDGFGFGSTSGLTNGTEMGHTLQSVEWYPTGFTPGWYTNSSRTTTTFPGASSGQRVGIAVDLDAGKAWICNASTAPSSFYGTALGDPTTGTNAFTWTPWSATAYIGWTSVQNGAGESVTMYVDSADFVGAAPSGFTPWGQGTTYSTSITEAASAADSVSAAILQAVAEAASAADSLTAAIDQTNLETATASDSVSASYVGVGVMAEAAAAADSLSITYAAPGLSATKLIGFITLAPPVPVVSASCVGIYPDDLPGLGFSVIRSQQFQTRIQRAVSGKELRALDYPWPLRRWTLTYEVLRDKPEDALPELRRLMGFFGLAYGASKCFCFIDPEDTQVTQGVIGTGDGSTVDFQLGRWLGDLYEPLDQVYDTTAIFFNGIDTTVYGNTWTVTDGVLTFASPPGLGTVITGTYAYYWRTRFVDDALPFEQFLEKFWSTRKVDLISCRD